MHSNLTKKLIKMCLEFPLYIGLGEVDLKSLSLMGLNYCLGQLKILQIRFSIGRACSSIDRTRQIMKSFSCSLYVLES